jgi:hypothetical protein
MFQKTIRESVANDGFPYVKLELGVKILLTFLMLTASPWAQTRSQVPSQNFGFAGAAAVSSGAPAAKYYVDSVNGNDANLGTSQAAPWKTIARVNAATIAPGSEILFLSTDIWHEQLTVPGPGMTFGAYGPQRTCRLSASLVATCANMPIIDGADAITGWSVQLGAAYKARYTSTVTKGFVDSLYAQTVPLMLQTSIANVVSTAGSIFSDGTNVYVHLVDGSNPAKHVVEVSGSRKYGINLNNQAGTTVTGLEIIRASKSGVVQGLAYPSNITISKNVFFNIGDTLGDASAGPLSSNEGAIYDYTGFCSCTLVNWVLAGNWIGEMDFAAADLDFNQAGIQLGASTSIKVIANKVATIHGAGIRLADSFGSSCTFPTLSENELTNSEGNLWLYGCSNATVTYNNAHDTFGNFLEIGNGNLTADVTNNAPYVAFNLFHDILPAYGNALFNGIDTNYSTNGTYYMNRCWKVSAACLTLEGSGNAATSSSGATVQFNSFDTSQNYSSTGLSGGGTAYPMYVVATALSGTTGRGNNFVFDPTSSSGIFFGGVSYSQSQFDLIFPGFEIQHLGVASAKPLKSSTPR